MEHLAFFVQPWLAENMIRTFSMAVMAVRRPIAEKPAEVMALIADGSLTGIAFMPLVVAVIPAGTWRRLASIGPEMAFKASLIRIVAIRAIHQVGECMKLFALNIQPRFPENMVDSCAMTVMADFRAGAELAFDAMALIADADAAFQC